MSSKYKSPSMSSQVEVDPSAPGTVIRRAFAIEAVLNLFVLPLILYPRATLSHMIQNPAEITSTTTLLARAWGGLVVGAFTPALLLGLPNTRAGIESRTTVYYMLGLGEMLLVPLLAWHAGEDGGLSAKACMVAITNLLPPLAWRVYTLCCKPEWFGRYRDVKGE